MAEKTKMTREWIERVWKDNPAVVLPNGNIRLGPSRAAFVNLLERPKPGADGKERAFGVVILLPELGGPVNIDVLQNEVKALFTEKAPQALTNKELFSKLNNPFKKQGAQVDKDGNIYDGFVEGRICISANSSKSAPPVVDQNLAPITDKRDVYSGCWIIPTLACRWFDVGTNKGPTFYLQSVMVVADDENLGGVGTANPNSDFAGVKIDAAVNPAAAFGVEGPTAGPSEPAAVDLLS